MSAPARCDSLADLHEERRAGAIYNLFSAHFLPRHLLPVTSRGPPPLIRLPTYPDLPPGLASLRAHERGRGRPRRAWGGAGPPGERRPGAGSRSLLPWPPALALSRPSRSGNPCRLPPPGLLSSGGGRPKLRWGGDGGWWSLPPARLSLGPESAEPRETGRASATVSLAPRSEAQSDSFGFACPSRAAPCPPLTQPDCPRTP